MPAFTCPLPCGTRGYRCACVAARRCGRAWPGKCFRAAPTVALEPKVGSEPEAGLGPPRSTLIPKRLASLGSLDSSTKPSGRTDEVTDLGKRTTHIVISPDTFFPICCHQSVRGPDRSNRRNKGDVTGRSRDAFLPTLLRLQGCAGCTVRGGLAKEREGLPIALVMGGKFWRECVGLLVPN